MMLMIISDGKNRQNSHNWRGWVKIGEKNAKNVISSNRFGWKLKYELYYKGIFRIQELANGDFGLQNKKREVLCVNKNL